VLSDDESDPVAPPPKRTSRQKSKVTLRTESPEREIDQATMALMDIDDGLCVLTIYHYSRFRYFLTDQVEKVIHETSTNVSTANDDDEMEQMDDVEMADGTTSEPKKARKKREKKIIPIGRNGLRKKKVMKTKKTMDDNGYMRKHLIWRCVFFMINR
jgi:DNA polymerase delta subunit 3